MGEDNFDLHQFYEHRDRAVSQSTCIDWSDYKRMGVVSASVNPRPMRWIPAFSTNMEQLRAVILEAERRSVRLNSLKCEEGRTHHAAVTRAGSARAYIAGIAHRAWLQRLDCIAIAQLMEISPAMVRQQLHKLIHAARDFGFETFNSSHLGKKRNKRKMYAARAATLRRKMYGSPVYVEDRDCFACRVKPINKARSKWRCDSCSDDYAYVQRKAYRKQVKPDPVAMEIRRIKNRRAAHGFRQRRKAA